MLAIESLVQKRQHRKIGMDFNGEECIRDHCFKYITSLTEATSRDTNRQQQKIVKKNRHSKAACEKT